MPNQDKQYYKNLYTELSKKYTKAELAEAFVFPSDWSEEEKAQADKEIWEHRKQRLLNRTPEQNIFSGLLRIRYQLEDYVHSKGYDKEQSVGKYLSAYMRVVGQKQKEMAANIAIHPARLSRILNNKERLSLTLAYRLEVHSGDLIPALLWWKLVQKEMEFEIQSDTTQKELEKKHVKNIAYRA